MTPDKLKQATDLQQKINQLKRHQAQINRIDNRERALKAPDCLTMPHFGAMQINVQDHDSHGHLLLETDLLNVDEFLFVYKLKLAHKIKQLEQQFERL